MHAESAVLHRYGASLDVDGEQRSHRENTVVNMLVKTFQQQVHRYDDKVQKKCFTFNVRFCLTAVMIFHKDWTCLQRLLALLLSCLLALPCIALPNWQTDIDASQVPYLYFCHSPTLLTTSKSTRRWATKVSLYLCTLSCDLQYLAKLIW